MANGFAGKILRVNLADSKVSEVETSRYIPKYVGGRGIATRIYWEEVGPEVGPFDPGNKLIFMTGPLQGTTAPGSGRLSVVGKSAQAYPTYTVTDSNAGGAFAPELKFAGWDGIIVEGKASKPVYIHINNGRASIMDARPLWGLTTHDAQVEIWRKHGWKTRAMVIGPAGENMSEIGSILIDNGSAFGQGGFGGVMGSKNLKAIAVRGTGSVEVARPDKLLEVTKHLKGLVSVRVGEMVAGYKGKEFGMLQRPPSPNIVNGDMVRMGVLKAGASSCYQCPIQCRLTAKFTDGSLPPSVSQCVEGMYLSPPLSQEYHRDAPWKKEGYIAATLQQQLGINAIEPWRLFFATGNFGVIPIFVELVKEGVLTKENTGWPVDKMDSTEFIDAVHMDMAYKKGFGAILAQGNCRALEYIATHDEFGPKRSRAWTFCREEYPMGGKFGGFGDHHNVFMQCLQYSTALYFATGQRDVSTKHKEQDFYSQTSRLGVKVESDEWYALLKPMMKKWIGTDKPIEPPGYEDAEIATRWWWQANFETDCLLLCDWWQFGRFWSPYTADGISDLEAGSKLYNAVTGEDISQKDLWARCEVPWTLERAIACREGRRAADDNYSDEWLAIQKDPKGRTFDKSKMTELNQKFYALVGWNKDGVPTRSRLEGLGLNDVADDLEARGVYG